MDISNVHQLILSGGGVLGYSYIGILKYLEEIQLIKQLNHIIGCSAGAIFATLIALGCSSDELYTALIELTPINYFAISLENIMKLPANKGIDSGDLFITKFKELIAVKTLQPDITFIELYERTGIHLEIGVTNISTYQFEVIFLLQFSDLIAHLL